MPLHNLVTVSALPSNQKDQLLNGRSGAMVHEAGHVVALRRYGLVPYYIYIGMVGSHGAAQRPVLISNNIKDDELISAAGALMERKLFGDYDRVGCISDMVSIAAGRQIKLKRSDLEAFTADVLREFGDFPTNNEAELAIKLHDKIEEIWDSGKEVKGYKKFTYYSLRSIIKSKNIIRDLDVSILSRFELRKSAI